VRASQSRVNSTPYPSDPRVIVGRGNNIDACELSPSKSFRARFEDQAVFRRLAAIGEGSFQFHEREAAFASTAAKSRMGEAGS